MGKDVESFLQVFKEAVEGRNIIFIDGLNSNPQVLADLELLPTDRQNVLKKLEPSDYCEGPLYDKMFKGSEQWIFGKTLRKKEIYIKITVGIKKACAVCVSFYISKNKVEYKFK